MLRPLFSLSALVLAGLLVGTPASADEVEDEPTVDTLHQAQGKKGKKRARNGRNQGNQNARRGKKGKKGKKGPQLVGPFKKNKYPTAEKLRPLTLPQGMGEAGLEVMYTRVADTDILNVGPSIAYGITDNIEAGAATGFALAPDVAFGDFVTVHGHYLAYDTAKLDVAPGVVIPLVFVENSGFGLTLEAPSRYLLKGKAFLYFGQGLIPIVIDPDFALRIVANGGVGYQINKQAFLFADTSVLTLNVVPDVDLTGIWDALTLNVGGQYTPTQNVDVGARLTVFNIWEVDNSLTAQFTVFGAFRF